MSIHIGRIIQSHVEDRRLTQKEFGALIHKHEKTVPDIYDRATMSIDLLISISGALKKDFLNFFYSEEPMSNLRTDEVTQLQQQVKALNEKTEQQTKELAHKQELIELQKDYLALAIERLEDCRGG
jgi:plasmid maintenance system antidote protein VapI